MRTPTYYLDTNRTTISPADYLEVLLDSIIGQTGAIRVANNGYWYDIFITEDPRRPAGYGEFAYTVVCRRRPDDYRYSPAKAIGFTTLDASEVKEFILGFDPDNHGTPHKPFSKKKVTVTEDTVIAKDW